MTDPDIQGAFNTKRPPSDHAIGKLLAVASYGESGMPAQEMNFTVRDKLLAFGYIRVELRPSSGWYKTHGPNKRVDFAIVTEKGIEFLRSQR